MSPYAVKPALVLWFLLLSCGVAAARQMHVQMSYPAAETVIDGRNALSGKHLGQARANAFHILHWSGRFQHLKRC